MSVYSTTLRPGLLVSCKTSIKGNVSYVKRDLEAYAAGGAQKAKWETERTIADAAEYEAATKVRSKARNLLASVCAASAFGMLCPENKADALDEAVGKARQLCDDFNSTAQVTRVTFYAITGRIAADDVEAVKAINSEVRDLIAQMKVGVESLDPKVIRAAADQAKQLGSMLSPDAQVRIQLAIDAARKEAVKMVKAGETAAVEIDRVTMTTLAEARTAFLDIDQDHREIGTPTATGRALDLTPEGNNGVTNAAAPVVARELELN